MELELIARRDRRIAKATAEVLRDLSVRRSRSEVARAAGLEPTYFSKRFQLVVGYSYTHWNMSIRMEAACELFSTTDRQVRHVARAVGYTDVTTFGRAFRKMTGMCPSEYRRRAVMREFPSGRRHADAIGLDRNERVSQGGTPVLRSGRASLGMNDEEESEPPST